MYFALLFAITLAAGLILHGIASLLSLVIWRLSRRRLDSISSFNAATVLLCLRMLPFALSLFLLAAFVLPAFLKYEPRTTIEPLSFTLLALSAVTAVVFFGSIRRCASAVMQARRVMRDWLADSQERSPCDGVEVHLCRAARPAIAAIGVWHTRIFVSASVAEGLSAEELQAALRHEAAHARNFDIAKKMLLQLSPTFLPGVDLLRPVTTHWANMCELVADEQSVASHPQRTLHLASALVKVARLAQSAQLPILSAALAAQNDSLLGRRVRRLLEIAEEPRHMIRGRAVNTRKLLLAAVCVLAWLLLIYPQALSATHELLEFLVQG